MLPQWAIVGAGGRPGTVPSPISWRASLVQLVLCLLPHTQTERKMEGRTPLERLDQVLSFE